MKLAHLEFYEIYNRIYVAAHWLERHQRHFGESSKKASDRV